MNEPREQLPGMTELPPVSHQEGRTRQQLVPLLTLWMHHRCPVPHKIHHPMLPSGLRHHTDRDSDTVPSPLDWGPQRVGAEQRQAGSRRRQGEREFKPLFQEDVDVGHGPVSQSSTEIQLFVRDVPGRQGCVSLVWEHSSTSALETGSINSSTSQMLSQNPRVIQVGKDLQDFTKSNL